MKSRYLIFVLLAAAVLGGRLKWFRRNDTSPRWTRPVTVEAIGREFVWWFRYPGADGIRNTSDDIELRRQLLLPSDVDVTLELKSEDYIYSMSLPDRNLKEIAVPDLHFELSFRTKPSEEFDLLVDPMCGFRFFHDDVMGHVSVTHRDDFSNYFGPPGHLP